MAYHPNIPTPTGVVQDELAQMRENFQHLDPLAQVVGELQAVSGLAPVASELQTVSELAQIADDLQVASALAPYVQALLDSRIVEMGSNSNGEYVRWENGLQVCWGTHSFGTVLAGVTVEATWTYPSEFASTPIVIIASNHSGSASHKSAFRHGAQPGMSSATVATTNATNADRICLAALIVIGRWK